MFCQDTAHYTSTFADLNCILGRRNFCQTKTLLFDNLPLNTKPKAMQNRKWMLEKVQRNVDTGLNPCKKLSTII